MACMSWAHPVHISVTTIEYQPEKKGFVVAFKIFYDDFSALLSNKNNRKVVIGSDDSDWSDLAVKYIRESFSMEINGKICSNRMKFVLHEMNHEAVWFYFAIPFKGNPLKSVKVDCKVLSDFYADQTNLVIIKTPGTEKGFSLKKPDLQCEVLL
jgi:hypothetical protein